MLQDTMDSDDEEKMDNLMLKIIEDQEECEKMLAKALVDVHEVYCELHELYTGCKKQINDSEFNIPAGTRDGEYIGCDDCDLVICVREKPHPEFKRVRDDLEYIYDGTNKEIKLLNGEIYLLIIDPKLTIVPIIVPNLGMPIKDSNKRGKLIVKSKKVD